MGKKHTLRRSKDSSKPISNNRNSTPSSLSFSSSSRFRNSLKRDDQVTKQL